MSVVHASHLFATPPLTETTVEELKALALSTATQVIYRSLQAGRNNASWSLTSSDNAIRIFKGQEPLGAHRGCRVLHCGQQQLRASLRDVVELLRTDTPAHAAAYTQRFGKDILGTTTLYMLEAPMRDTPNRWMTVKWFAYQSPLKKVVMNRDAVVLECHREFTIQGRRGWVRAVRSIQLPGCPNLEASCGLVRMQNYGSGHVFLESLDKPGYLDMSYVTEVDVGVGRSEWAVDAFRSRNYLVEKAIVRRCQFMLEIERYLKGETTISSQDIRVHDALTTKCRKALRWRCCLCDKRFGPLSKKKSCTQCHRTMCRQCDREWRVKSQSSESTCTTCALGREQQLRCNATSSTTMSPAPDRWRSETVLNSTHDSVGSHSTLEDDDTDSLKDHDVTANNIPPQRCYQPSVVYKGNCYGGQGFILLRSSASTPVVFDQLC
ncbi:hypothetical protein H310_10192 [Aphanomyces invadans]|uniref:FYVE-type domain-containing protein n=1 Tax=Aphanomyces invadans TaxID=157072 RepID=A0A024TR10_9STRA|nr:hypothetical protein H310_10192 [Aphanomyces invadans]ETV96438.1 hypothetical protein H310_10192 [Aphanomyces invadans]|eukprot:XP_008874701.1 hypothetical protein H310_10192 [Aphanomyces invadans]